MPMYGTTMGEQVRTFAKIAFDMYKLGWNTGDFSQFINLLNKVGVQFINEDPQEDLKGRAGYKRIVELIDDKSRQGDRLNLNLKDTEQKAAQVTFTFEYQGMQDGIRIEGVRKLVLGVQNAKIVRYHLHELQPAES